MGSRGGSEDGGNWDRWRCNGVCRYDCYQDCRPYGLKYILPRDKTLITFSILLSDKSLRQLDALESNWDPWNSSESFLRRLDALRSI